MNVVILNVVLELEPSLIPVHGLPIFNWTVSTYSITLGDTIGFEASMHLSQVMDFKGGDGFVLVATDQKTIMTLWVAWSTR